MKKLFLSLGIIASLSVAKAQTFNYDFSVYTDSYTPLTGGTSMNDTVEWDHQNFAAPLDFTFYYDDKMANYLHLMSGNAAFSDTQGTLSGFIIAGCNLWDRGSTDTIAGSQSPIRYLSTGTAPNRIFKAEVFNAGFKAEFINFSTNFDSLNYQVWLYEGSNIFEIRIGDSKVSHMSTYFSSNKASFGFMQYRIWTGSFHYFYYLKGNPASPTLDSTNIITGDGITAIPASGTVYRFTPKSVSIKNTATTLTNIKVYPTICKNELTIDNTEKGKLSYSIYSTTGALVKQGSLQAGANRIDVTSIATGSYIIRLSSEAGIKTVSFIKE
jgi:hypothetical protein